MREASTKTLRRRLSETGLSAHMTRLETATRKVESTLDWQFPLKPNLEKSMKRFFSISVNNSLPNIL